MNSNVTAFFLLLGCSLSMCQAQSNASYRDLHDFGGTVTNADGTQGADGILCYSTVVKDRHGNLFGTTEKGGPNFYGLIWEITASGTYVDLHDFGGTITCANGQTGQDGWGPTAGVTFDAQGNMYGSARYGGFYGATGGMVWEITTSGVYKDLHDFGGTVVNADGSVGPDAHLPASALTVDASGNVYGTTWYGGATGTGGGNVWEVTASGVYKDLHDFGETVTNANGTQGPDGAGSDSTVTIDSHGNLYGTTNYLGPYSTSLGASAGNFWEITSEGTYKDLHDFGATITNANGKSGPDGVGSVAGVTFDLNGNAYGTCAGGGASGGGILWEYTVDGTYKDVHDFGGTITIASGASGPDGTNPSSPVVFDPFGNMYGIACNGGGISSSSGMIWEVTSAGVYKDVHDFGGNITNENGTPGPDGGYPYAGITIDSNGNLFGSTAQGGPNGVGMVWKIAVSVTGLSVNPTSVLGGTPVEATVTLSEVAPVGGYVTSVSSNSPSVIAPTSVTVPAGGQSATFAILTAGVNTSTSVVITAGGQTAGITVLPATLTSLSLSSGSVVGGNSLTGTIKLSGPAGAGGTLISLGSSSTAAQVASSFVFPAGQSTTQFTILTFGVKQPTSADITASLNGKVAFAPLAISPAVLESVSVSPSLVVGGNPSTGTVTLTGSAPTGGTTVDLSKSGSSVTLPKTVKFEPGSNHATFTVSTLGVNAPKAVILTAKSGSLTKTATLTLDPPTVSGVNISPALVTGGSSAEFTITLSGAAGPNGVSVKLVSNNSAAKVAPSLNIGAGKTSGKATVRTSAVSSAQVAAISASLNGVTQSTNLTVNCAVIATLSLSPASVKGGSSSIGKVTLSGPAGPGGMKISLSCSDSSVTLPSSIAIAAGKTQVNFTIKTKKVTEKSAATVSASQGGVSLSSTLTIT